MALSDVQTLFTSILNRRDCPAATALIFIQQGQSLIQRTLRIPSMERVYRVQLPAGADPMASLPLPEDCLQIIDVMVNGHSLERKGLRDLTRHPWWDLQPQGSFIAPGATCAPFIRPQAFARVGATLQFAPLLYGPSEFLMTYYGAMANLVNPTDTNELTPAFNDLLTYAALTYAGDWSRNDQLQVWKQSFEELMEQVQDAANQLDATGGSVVIRAPHGDY